MIGEKSGIVSRVTNSENAIRPVSKTIMDQLILARVFGIGERTSKARHHVVCDDRNQGQRILFFASVSNSIAHIICSMFQKSAGLHTYIFVPCA
jgi:hypothetical protein